MNKAKKYVVCWNSVLAILAFLVIVLNMIISGSKNSLPDPIMKILDGILFVIFVLIEVFVVRRGYLKRSCQIRIETEENITDKKEE